MKHFLGDLYQDWSYDARWVRTGPAMGLTSWNIGTKIDKFRNSSSLKVEGLEV